jgi:hypothetical protein
MYSYIISQAIATLVGMARGAYELFLERLPGRAIAYTQWTDQKLHPLTQIQVATTSTKIAAAEGLLTGLYDLLQRRADLLEEPTLEEKARVRAHSAYAAQLAREAVEELFHASGAGVVQRAVPLGRFHHDIQAVCQHGLVLPASAFEAYGQVLLGLEVGTPVL